MRSASRALRMMEVFPPREPGRGASLDPQKPAKDAAVLEAALKEDPNNARYVFYLAQSYRDMKEWKKALLSHTVQRTTMGGFDQEVYAAYFYAAFCAEELKLDSEHGPRLGSCRPTRGRRSAPICCARRARHRRAKGQVAVGSFFCPGKPRRCHIPASSMSAFSFMKDVYGLARSG